MKMDAKGFTLVEIIIATGLLAALSLGVMSLQKNMTTGQVTSETKMEELEIRRIIMTTLLDQTACVNTFSGTNIGSPITQIKNSLNTPLFQTNSTYGNNSIQLVSMNTQDIAAVNSTTRDINLNLSFKRMKSMASNSGSVKNVSIQIRVNAVSGTAPITGCFVDASATNQAMCLSLGGIWNATVNTCKPIPYVSISGDSMTGPLNVPTLTSSGNVNSPNFCTGNNCKAIHDLALANTSCPAGQAQIGVNSNGTPRCKPLQCGPNLYFAGLDSSSNPVCRPYPTNTCPTNQYVSSVNADGTVNCAILPNNANANCPAGQVIQSINAGIPTCVNKGAGTVCAVGQVVSAVHGDGSVTCVSNLLNISCPSGQVLNGISNGNPVCVSSTPATGILGITSTFMGQGNVGVHKFCALMVVQNGWNSNIGNNQIGVYRQGNGSWVVSGACDPNRCGAVCLD